MRLDLAALALCAAGPLAAQQPAPTPPTSVPAPPAPRRDPPARDTTANAKSGAPPVVVAPTARRPLQADDLYRLRSVRDPQRSPDGRWVAYTVSTPDSARDKADADLWMTSWDGRETVRLTWTPESEGTPRWSPDDRYLAFLSGRQDSKDGQVWLLDRRGGEAQRVTQVKGGVSDLAWSPDGRRLALVLDEETDSTARLDTAEVKTPKPIVVDRYGFKRDVDGYLGTHRSRLAVYDLAAKQLDTLAARAPTDDDQPSWSPDGTRLAFVRSTPPEPGRAGGAAIYVTEARSGAAAVKLTGNVPVAEGGGRPAWSPDGRFVAFLRGDEPKYYAYVQPALAVVAADGRSAPRVIAPALDRPVSDLAFAADGRAVWGIVTDDRVQYLMRIRLTDGAAERVLGGRRVVEAFSAPPGGQGRVAVLASTPDRASEVYALENGALRALSHQNDSLFAQLALGPTEDVSSRSVDGTEVHGVLLRPAPSSGAPAGRLPLVLRIHGGPAGQEDYGFDFEHSLLAAQGYAVLAVNYRGSNGRGATYQKAIFADWGHHEVEDLLGAVDHVVAAGVADSARLGIGGWSYGGILTDYTIATTPRFKAAISGAGSALQLSMYGSDMYVSQYEYELGQPWKQPALWAKVSYPFYQADRIRTPTLFLVGEKDFNVPAVGSEQMYQALRAVGVPTQLVIYPGQFHGLTTPSYQVDRLRRYVAWYDRWLKPGAATAAAGAGR